MSDLDTLLSQLDNFWKGKRAVKKLIKLGTDNPEKVVPPLIELMDDKNKKIRDKAIEAYKNIAKNVDVMPVIFKVPIVKTIWNSNRPDESVYCVDIGDLNGTQVVVSGARDTNVYVWDMKGNLIWRGMESTSGLTCLEIGELGDKDVVVAGSGKAFGDSSDTNVYAWDGSGRLLWRGIETESWVSSIKIGVLGGNEVVVGGCGGLFSSSTNLFVWNKKGKVMWKGSEPLSWVSEVEIMNSEKGDLVAATCGDNSLYVWDEYGRLQWKGDQPVGALTDMATGSLGKKKVIAGISSNLYVWDLKGDLLWVATHPSSWLRSVAIGRYMGRRVVLAGSGEGEVFVWNSEGKLLKKYDDPDDGINELEIGKIGEQNMIVAGSRDSNVYMWTAGEKDPWIGKQARKEINDIDTCKFGKKNIVMAVSRDKNVYSYESLYSSVDELLDELEENIPSPELRKEYSKLSDSLKEFNPENREEVYEKIKDLTDKITKKQEEVRGMIKEFESIKRHISEFKQRDIQTQELEISLKKGKEALDGGDVDKAKEILHTINKDVSEIQSEIKKEERKRNRFKKWIDDLDVEYEKVTDELIDELEPIFTKFLDVKEDDTIDNRISEIRKDITKLKDISQKYNNIQSDDKYNGKLAEELKSSVEEQGNTLRNELESLKELREEKENGLLMIKDPASTLVMQYESGDSWVKPDKIADRIEDLQKDIKKEIIKTDNKVESIKRNIRITTGINDVFIPKTFDGKDDILKSIESLKEEYKSILSGDVELDTGDIKKDLKRRDKRGASKKMNKLRYDVRKYKKIQEEIDKLSQKKKKLPTIVTRGEIDESFYVEEDKRIANNIQELEEESQRLKADIFI